MNILQQVINKAVANGAETVVNQNKCRLEGWSYGHLDAHVIHDANGFKVVSDCGKVSIRVRDSLIYSRFKETSIPTFYYE